TKPRSSVISQEAEQALAAKDWDAAGCSLGHLARLTPNVPEVYANLGTVYYTQGRYAQAAEALERALKLNPEIPNVPLILAICYAELGRAKEAVPVLEPAFRHPPNHEIGRTRTRPHTSCLQACTTTWETRQTIR